MFDIICVGSASVDVFVKTHFSQLIKKCKNKGIPCDLQGYPLGSKILIDELLFSSGGCGTNTAVAFSKLGLKTAFLGKTGSGTNAALIERELKQANVKNLAIKDKNERTGYSIILDSVQQDRTILTAKGSNNTLKKSEVPFQKLKTKWFFFSTMMNTSYQTLKTIASFAKRKKIPIALNISEYLAKKGVSYLKPILLATTIFILNKQESLMLTKKKSEKKAAETILKNGPEIVVITNGKKGATTYTQETIHHIQANKIKIVETTGAGDAFASGFVAGYIKKNDISFALQLARANAESVIKHHGAKQKLLTWKEAIKRIYR